MSSFSELLARKEGGSRVGDFFKKAVQKVKKFFSPDLENFPKSSQNVLRSHGDNPIVSLQVARTPLSKGLKGLLDAITLGRFSAVQKQKYSDLFHLFLVAQVKRPDGSTQQIVVEKNERANVATTFTINAGTEIKQVPLRGQSLSVNDMLEKTIQKIGKRQFFQYRAFSWNCQDFISNILQSNGLLTKSLQEFILQDTDYLVKKLPKSTEAIANLATDTGALVSKWLGKGKMTNLAKKAMANQMKKDGRESHASLLLEAMEATKLKEDLRQAQKLRERQLNVLRKERIKRRKEKVERKVQRRADRTGATGFIVSGDETFKVGQGREPTYPHRMFKGKSVRIAKTPADHNRLMKLGYTHSLQGGIRKELEGLNLQQLIELRDRLMDEIEEKQARGEDTSQIEDILNDIQDRIDELEGREPFRGGSKASGYIAALMAKKYDTPLSAKKPTLISKNLAKQIKKRTRKPIKKLTTPAPEQKGVNRRGLFMNPMSFQELLKQ